LSLNYELHEKELLLYPILQNIEDGLIITDTSLRIIFFNEAAERIFQVEADQVLGSHLNNLKPDLKIQQMIDNHLRFDKSKILIRGEEVLITRGLLGTPEDLSAAYAILRPIDNLNEYQLNSFLANPYEGITVFNDKLEIIYANQSCYRFLKCNSKDELVSEVNSIIPVTNLPGIWTTVNRQREK
jgi:PAS domain-containing protein